MTKTNITNKILKLSSKINTTLTRRITLLLILLLIFYAAVIRFQEPIINQIIGTILIITGIFTGLLYSKQIATKIIIATIPLVLFALPFVQAINDIMLPNAQEFKEISMTFIILLTLYLVPLAITQAIKLLYLEEDKN